MAAEAVGIPIINHMAVIQLENYTGLLQVEVRPDKLWATHERASYVVGLEQNGIPLFTAEHFRSGFSEHAAIRKVAMSISDACTYHDWNAFFRCSVFSLGLIKFEEDLIQCRFYLLRNEPHLADSYEAFLSVPGNCSHEALFQFAIDLYAEADEAHRIDDQYFVDNINRPKPE